MQKLSENFQLSEFIYSSVSKEEIRPTKFQIEKLKYLAQNILQPIRDKWGPLRITSGLRTYKTYLALKKKGYPASKTSDHFLIPYLKWSVIKQMWLVPSDVPNPRGKGAADFIAIRANAWDVWYWVLENFKPGEDYNQFIIYPKNYSYVKTDYFHISNPAKIFNCPSIVPSKRPILVFVKGNNNFDEEFVSFEKFIKIMGKKFKERR